MTRSSEIPAVEMSGNATDANLGQFVSETRNLVDAALDRILPSEILPPQKVHAAIRWSVFAGGKRFRPLLLLAVGETFEADLTLLMNTACASLESLRRPTELLRAIAEFILERQA
jgi:hypothetical protein